MNSPDSAKSQRSAENSSFDFVQAVCGFAGLAGFRYRSLGVSAFSISAFQLYPNSPFPRHPPLFPHLRSGHQLFQRPSTQKQTPSQPKSEDITKYNGAAQCGRHLKNASSHCRWKLPLSMLRKPYAKMNDFLLDSHDISG